MTRTIYTLFTANFIGLPEEATLLPVVTHCSMTSAPTRSVFPMSCGETGEPSPEISKKQLFVIERSPPVPATALQLCGLPVSLEVEILVQKADSLISHLQMELDVVATDRDDVVLAIIHPRKVGMVALIDPLGEVVSLFVPPSCDEEGDALAALLNINGVRCDVYRINLQDNPVLYSIFLAGEEVEEVEVVNACRLLAGEVVFDSIYD